MPFWEAISFTISGARASRAVARRSMTSARRAGSQVDQPLGSSNARRAASTARSTSSSTPSGTLPMVSSVVAETTVMVSLPAGWIHSPPMNSDSWVVVVMGWVSSGWLVHGLSDIW